MSDPSRDAYRELHRRITSQRHEIKALHDRLAYEKSSSLTAYAEIERIRAEKASAWAQVFEWKAKCVLLEEELRRLKEKP